MTLNAGDSLIFPLILDYYCMVSNLFHHAAICPFTCLKKIANIVILDFVLTLIWHTDN